MSTSLTGLHGWWQTVTADDLDGDGEYEIILKWDPTNSKDNSQSGYTGNVYLDAYKMNGTRLWRIDLGINIRAGAHYTQFMVYDLDGDGKAELTSSAPLGVVVPMPTCAFINKLVPIRNNRSVIFFFISLQFLGFNMPLI